MIVDDAIGGSWGEKRCELGRCHRYGLKRRWASSSQYPRSRRRRRKLSLLQDNGDKGNALVRYTREGRVVSACKVVSEVGGNNQSRKPTQI
jgi:hypothetical protein